LAQTATAPPATGPLVWLDMDQKALDDAYDQMVYAPNRDQVHKRNVFNSDRVRARLGAPKRFAYGPTPIEGLDLFPVPLPYPPPQAGEGGEGAVKLPTDDKIRRVVICSGKVYFDLYEEREKRGVNDVYLLRVEQLYPVPMKALVHELSRFKQSEMVWCQEEPRNMGAWFFIDPFLEWVLNNIQAKQRIPRYAGRSASAATATGLMSKHVSQLKAFLEEALG